MFDWNERITQNESETTFTCLKCSHRYTFPTVPNLEMVACPKCKAIHTKELKYGSQYFNLNNNLNKNEPQIFRFLPLGTKGNWQGKELTVIGHAAKEELINIYGYWQEVSLIDAEGNIYFLNECYGHFHLVQQVNIQLPEYYKGDERNKLVLNDGASYEYFHGYRYQTNYINGAFNYNPIDVSKIKCYDYISPPEIISVECTSKHVDVFKGVYLKRKEVVRMFNEDGISIIDQEGVGAAQPFFFQNGFLNYTRVAIAFCFLLILLGVLMGSSKETSRVVSEFSIPVPGGSESSSLITPSFYITEDEAPAYLRFNVFTALSNEWQEMQFILINDKTAEQREFVMNLEYYYGTDGGYDWSEGSTQAERFLSSVEPGKYHFEINAYHGVAMSNRPIFVAVVTDTTLLWNCLLFIIPVILSIWGLYRWESNFNARRTGSSDY